MKEDALAVADELTQLGSMNSMDIGLAIRAAIILREQAEMIKRLNNEIDMLSIDLSVSKGFIKTS